MKKHVALAMLGITLAGVVGTHVRWVQADNGHLLELSGQPVDALGAWADWRNALTRDCSQVQALHNDNAALQTAHEVIRNISPPDSATARVQGLWRRGDWWLAETEFEQLLPAVVLLQLTPAGLVPVQGAVWSGTTHPWRAAPLIRGYISQQAPQAPADLLACFEARSVAFR
jgi:hypothetical protein